MKAKEGFKLLINIAKNTLQKKFNNTNVLWFVASQRFIMLEKQGFDVFELLSAGDTQEKIIAFCKQKYPEHQHEIPQFVSEMAEVFKELNKTENRENISVKAPEINFSEIHFVHTIFYQIGKKTIAINYQTTYLKSIFHPALAHLETHLMQNKTHKISLFENDGILSFSYQNKIIESFKKEDEHYFTGCFRQLLHSVLYEQDYNNWMMALHASSVAKNENAVVFSAVGGSGKSTLSALLKAQGYYFINDDFITTDKKGYVFPFPAAISVKKGSVKTLSEPYPELHEISSEETRIGKIVQYLPVENLSENYENSFPIKAFVFLKYDSKAEPIFKPVDKKTALQELLQETWVKPGAKNVEAFFKWIENTNFYRLQYSENHQAIDLVEKLFES